MAVLLRLLVVFFAVATALLATLLTSNIWLEERQGGVIKMGLLALLVCLAAYASIQLWRLRHGGRYAGLAILVALGLLMATGGPQHLRLDFVDLFLVASGVAVGATLFLPAARRACR